MKRNGMSVLQLGITVMLIISLSACDKEKVTRSYTWYTPVYRALPEVRAEMRSSPPRPVKNPGKIYIIAITFSLMSLMKVFTFLTT